MLGMSGSRGRGDGTGVIWISSCVDRTDCREFGEEDSHGVVLVSTDIRGSADTKVWCGVGPFFHSPSIACQNVPKKRELAFLNFRHPETLSSSTLTLSQPSRRWTGALLSSLSRTVLR